jgi:hypothetical protein
VDDILVDAVIKIKPEISLLFIFSLSLETLKNYSKTWLNLIISPEYVCGS